MSFQTGFPFALRMAIIEFNEWSKKGKSYGNFNEIKGIFLNKLKNNVGKYTDNERKHLHHYLNIDMMTISVGSKGISSLSFHKPEGKSYYVSNKQELYIKELNLAVAETNFSILQLEMNLSLDNIKFDIKQSLNKLDSFHFT